MDHPKDYSLFGLGLLGVSVGKYTVRPMDGDREFGIGRRVTRCNCLTPGQLSALIYVEETLPEDLQE